MYGVCVCMFLRLSLRTYLFSALVDSAHGDSTLRRPWDFAESAGGERWNPAHADPALRSSSSAFEGRETSREEDMDNERREEGDSRQEREGEAYEKREGEVHREGEDAHTQEGQRLTMEGESASMEGDSAPMEYSQSIAGLREHQYPSKAPGVCSLFYNTWTWTPLVRVALVCRVCLCVYRTERRVQHTLHTKVSAAQRGAQPPLSHTRAIHSHTCTFTLTVVFVSTSTCL